jgi:hypothetical protein
MVVPVLITSCQVSLYLKIGPVTPPNNDQAHRYDECQRVPRYVFDLFGEYGEPMMRMLHISTTPLQ